MNLQLRQDIAFITINLYNNYIPLSANQPYYEEIVAIDGPVPQINFIIANHKHKDYMKRRTRISRALAPADCRRGLARA